jgi:hypothetical protein
MNNIYDMVPMADTNHKRETEPTGSVSNDAILSGKVRDKSKKRKEAKVLEGKSFEELYGAESQKYPYEDALVREQKLLKSRGWKKVPHKFHPGLFEEIYKHEKYPNFKIVLMDLQDWQVEKADEVLKHGHGIKELKAYLIAVFK